MMDLVASEDAVAAASDEVAAVLAPLRDPRLAGLRQAEENRAAAVRLLSGDACYLAHAAAVIAAVADRARRVQSGELPFVADKLFTPEETKVVELAVVVGERAGAAWVAPAYAALRDLVVSPTGVKSMPSQGMAYALARAVAAAPTSAGIAAIVDATGRTRHAALRKRFAKLRDRLLGEHGGDPGPLGFDASGHLVWDLGTRSFRLSVRGDGKLAVRELDADGRPKGAVRTSLPAPRAADDLDRFAAAKTQLTGLRTTITAVARGQRRQWESAMVERRAWSGAEHRAAVAAHPVVGPLAEGLVWHIEAPDAAPVLVRTAELGEYLDVDAEPCAVADGARVSLPHPLDLSDAERDAWRRHLDDHELVQPVEQLDRAVFGRVAGGPPAPGGRVHGGSLVSLMERHGWRRDFDERVRGHLWRPFVAHGVAVVLVLDPGLTTGALHESAPQRVSGVLLQPADRPDAWAREQRSWDLVDALVVSEVRRSLAAIAAKAE